MQSHYPSFMQCCDPQCMQRGYPEFTQRFAHIRVKILLLTYANRIHFCRGSSPLMQCVYSIFLEWSKCSVAAMQRDLVMLCIYAARLPRMPEVRLICIYAADLTAFQQSQCPSFMQQVGLNLCSRFAYICAAGLLAFMQQIYVHLCRRSSGMYTADLLAFMQTFVWHVCSRFTCIYAADIQSTIRLPHIYAGSLPIFEMRLPGPIL